MELVVVGNRLAACVARILPTAGFYHGDYDFGVIAGSMHMARVSRHNLSYECPGTYLIFFYKV